MEDLIEKELESDIKREFQLERMVLFSDAVFAIVITLMAIEIKVPEADHKYTSDEMLQHIKMLLPTILAYFVSFIFIGMTWYRHLQIFGKLKDYDRGLVICNLALLLFIGLFPFGASMISHPNNILLPYIVYFIIAFMATGAQTMLQYYIFLKKNTLLHVPPTPEELEKFKISAILLLCFCVGVAVSITLFGYIQDPEKKPYAMLALFIVPITKRVLERRLKAKKQNHK